MNSFLNSLNWRFATKKFDTTKKVSGEDIQKIKDAILLSPSSFGIQPFRVVVIENQNLKQELKDASLGNSQVADCSHLFVFVARTDLQKRIGEYADLIKAKSDAGLFDRMKFEAGARTFFGLVGMNEEKKLRIASNQTYIALGFALAACAELHIDSCPMEGFSADSYHNILNLKQDEYAAVLLAVGYRAADPAFAKTRFSEEDIFENK